MRHRIWKNILFVLAMGLVSCMMLQSTPAQAANTTNYVMADETCARVANNKQYYQITKNGYSVKIQNNVLYTRKGSGNWKGIVRAASGRYMSSQFTTNGNKIYYSVSNSRGGYTVYSISVKGKSKKELFSSSDPVDVFYRYGNKLFFSARDVVKQYSLSSGTIKTLVSGYRGRYAQGKYILLNGFTTGGDPYPSSLYSYNASTEKLIKITSKAEDYSVYKTSSRIYYVEWISQYQGFGPGGKNQETFQIRSCKWNGTNKKNHTPKFKAYGVRKVTDKYVQYYGDGHYSKVYQYTYSTKKTKRVS